MVNDRHNHIFYRVIHNNHGKKLMFLLYMVFHQHIFLLKQLYQAILAMVDHLLVEVQHLKIIHHVAQHPKKIVQVELVVIMKNQKMIDIKNDIEMIVNIIHQHVVVHHRKIVDHHHLIVHVIEVEIMNMNDLEVIENHHEIEMINMNVIHENDIIEKKVDVIIEVMMNHLVVIVHHVVHQQKIFLHHQNFFLLVTTKFLQQSLLKS